MSSHHIVREKQEPALLVLGLQNFSFEFLGQLLEWCPTVIATDETIYQLNADQIKVDWLLTDNPITGLQTNIKIIALNGGSALNVAMHKLVADGYPAVNIITDSFTEPDYLPYANSADLVIYEAHRKIYPVKSGFNKWNPKGDALEIISGPTNIKHTGLRQLHGNKFETIADGFFSVSFNKPFVFLAEGI